MEQSPGLVVMGGGDSHSKGLGFKSQHRILDGHLFTHICCKNFNVCLKRPKKTEKVIFVRSIWIMPIPGWIITLAS